MVEEEEEEEEDSGRSNGKQWRRLLHGKRWRKEEGDLAIAVDMKKRKVGKGIGEEGDGKKRKRGYRNGFEGHRVILL
jgi:hypothetical protein